MRDLPPLQWLVPFHAVARHLSFTKAADELYVSHSSVSQNVKKLEEFLRQALFERRSNGVVLTKEGEQYFQSINSALSTIQKATSRLLIDEQRQILTVNMLSSFAMRWLIPRLQGFQVAYPQYEIRLCSEWRSVDFYQENIDVAVYYGNGVWPSVQSSLLFQEEITIMASPKLVKKSSISDYSSLLDQFRFLYVQSSRREDNFTIYCAHAGLEEPVESQRIYFQNTLQCLDAALHGAGLIAANKHFLKNELDSGALVSLLSQTVTTGQGFYLVTPDHQHISAAALDFKRWILAEAAADQAH